jgi:hypothetical protein
MSFATNSTKSVSSPRVLVELDIGKLNLQWINIGAGIWYVNFDNLYPEVDASLLDGFTSQTFGTIGSVRVDGAQQTKVLTLGALTDDTESYYYDSTNNELYVCLVNYEEPALHNISLGVVYGYSFDDFVPIDSEILYEGRLLSNPSISISRDPLFFGKIQYNISGFSLANADGYFDTFAIDNDIYGNEARIKFGYEDISINDYLQLYSGILGKVTPSEDVIDFSLEDKRKSLTKSITYTCTNKNALDVIQEVLETNYNAVYNDTYFDTTAWAVAQALVPNVTINIASGKDMDDIPVNDLIENICGSVFGLFIIDNASRYSFKIVDTTASASTTIYANDILSNHSIEYDPTNVITSAKVGYNKNWEEGYTSPYTWFYSNTTTSGLAIEEASYLKYKIYNQKEFTTLLISLANATSYSDTMLAYSKDVHGVGVIDTSMKYYAISLGDIVNIEIKRPNNITMLGTKKCEIISKTYNLYSATITFGYRII